MKHKVVLYAHEKLQQLKVAVESLQVVHFPRRIEWYEVIRDRLLIPAFQLPTLDFWRQAPISSPY